MKQLTIALMTMFWSFYSVAQTCETNFSVQVAAARTYCTTLVNPDCSFSVREFLDETGGMPILLVRCWRECPQSPTASGYISTGVGYFCTKNSIPSGPSAPLEAPSICPGSIVQVEDQILGESIPIVDAGFALNYFTSWAEGRISDYTLKIPLIGTTPRDDINSFDVTLKNNGSVLQTAHYDNTGSNILFQYTWSGLDSNGRATLGGAAFDVTVVENRTSISVPVNKTVVLGHFNAKLLGLGGWVPSTYAFYDASARRLYKGDGSVRAVEDKVFGLNQRMVAENDGSKVYIFDSSGKIIFIKSGLLGNTTHTFNYNIEGQLISINEPFGKTTYFNRDIDGKFISITAPNGAISNVTLESNELLASVSNSLNETYQMSYYGSNGLLYTFKKPGLQISTFSYDLDGNLIQDSHSGGYFFNLVKNLNSSYKIDLNMNSPMGRSVRTYGNGSSEAFNKTIVYSSSIQESLSYSNGTTTKTSSWSKDGQSGNLSYSIDPRFGSQAFYLQNNTMQTGVGYKVETRTTNSTLSDPSNPFSLVSQTNISQFNYSNNKITTVFDGISKTFSSSSYLGKTSQYSIDSYERVVNQKTGNIQSVEFTYTNENLTKIKQSTRETNLSYDATTGRLQSVVDPLSQTTGFVYDDVGRVTAKMLPDSRVIGYSYDPNGNVASITPPGRPAHYFDLNSQELASSYAPPSLSGVSVVNTTYSYNLDKQLTQVARPDGAAVSFNYNSTTGVLTSVSTPSGTYTYNMNYQNGLPSTIYSPGGAFTQLSYAGKKIVSSANYSSSYQNIGTYSPSFSSYSLLMADNISTYAGSGTSVAYSYNDDEDLTGVGSLSLSYNTPNGQLTGTTIGSSGADVIDSYTYNSYGEVTGYQAKYAGSVIYDLALTRDGMGRISGKSQSMNSVTDAFAYIFDVTGRLTQTDKNSATVATYVYDDNSNRTGGVIGAQTTTATYDNQDRLNTYNTLSFTYNANGDLTSKTNNTLSQTTNYVYDVFGNLTQVTLPSTDIITYEVDGLNRRIGKKLNGILQTRWIYMDQYRIVAEVDASGLVTKRFVYGSKENIPDYMIYGGENYRIISDHLGSPRLVVKVSDGSVTERMNHDEYGRVIEDTNPGYLPFGFAGGQYDNQTGLLRFGARDYDSEIGRWTSKDPIRFDGDDSNLFGYVAQDPANSTDPSGLYKVCKRRLEGFMGLFYSHVYLCAKDKNGVEKCGGLGPSGSMYGSPGKNDSTGGTCGKNLPNSCMDECISGKVSNNSRPYYSVIGAGSRCDVWAQEVINQCVSTCTK